MRNFTYFRPATAEQAVGLLDPHWGKVELLAGGTDLHDLQKQYIAQPDTVVSLNGLSLPAALIGGAFITLVPTYLAQAGDWVPILYGVALIVVTLVANADGWLRWRTGRGRR